MGWLSIFFWAVSVILTNSYVLYTKMCDEDNVKKSDCYTRYDFLKEVGMYWMNSNYCAQGKKLKNCYIQEYTTATTFEPRIKKKLDIAIQQ